MFRSRRPLVLALAVGVFASVSAGAVTQASDGRGSAPTPATLAARTAMAAQTPYDFTPPRLRTPQDRYAPAGGCYTLRSLTSGKYVARTESSFTASGASTGEPIRFQPYDLGKYLLYAGQTDFLASAADPAPGGARPATDVAQDYLSGTGDDTLKPARDPLLDASQKLENASDAATLPVRDRIRGNGVVAAARPSASAEWILKQAGNGAFTLQQPVDDGQPESPGPLDPPIATTLVAAASGALSLAPGKLSSRAAQFSLQTTTGCAAWPEAQLNVSGPHLTGATPFGQTRGYLDAHVHGQAFEYFGGRLHCGRSWHPYGITHALVDCPDHTAANGQAAAGELVFSGQKPGQGHDTVGWPTFGFWPNNASLTHEQFYYAWLQRAWMGGLRMYTNLLTDNRQLCLVFPLKKNSCNEMDSVRLQAQRLHELERYIDAQSGGPGTGWFRIVKDPFEARRVINAGKLAVVMGIETTVPLDCGEYLGTANCTAAQIDERMQGVYDLGVRQMEMTNKYDNALTGVTGDTNDAGTVVNTGNKLETGHYWKMQTCADAHSVSHDKHQTNVADSSGGAVGRDAVFAAVLQTVGGTGAAPVYPSGPHCNAIGLSDLGRHFLTAMVKRGMVFDPDHMSSKARVQALDILTKQGYSGIISSHSWSDDLVYRRILSMGGVVTPSPDAPENSTGLVKAWRQLRRWSDPRFTFGLGWGSDVGGISAQGEPRNPKPGKGVAYPFTGFGGARVDKQVTGKHVWDINTEGVDHYGLYPDWVQDATLVAGAQAGAFTADVERGPEAYLQMWERGLGVAGDACRSDVPDLTQRQLSAARLGMTPEAVLAAVGQPNARGDSAFTYCVQGGRTQIVFGPGGTVTKVGRS